MSTLLTQQDTIPQYQESLIDFLYQLRKRCFSSQAAAARYFHCHRSTITRYENGDISPPFGYIATLLLKLSERYEPTEAVHLALLKELSRATRNRQAYEAEQPCRSWDELVQVAQSYLHSQLEPENSLSETETSETPSQPKRDSQSDQAQSKLIGAWSISPDVTKFQAREAEIATIKGWIVDEQCRLVSIVGLGGMGKSMLAKKIALEIFDEAADDFDAIMWLSLQIPVPIQQTLTDCIRYITKEPDSEISTDLNALFTQCLNVFSTKRCLVVLDNLEGVLAEYEPFVSQLGKTAHRSTILITSRQKPLSISTQEGEGMPVRSLSLQGIEMSSARMILQHKGLSGQEQVWQQLVQNLSGNLLALEMAASTIRDFYHGDIAQFVGDTDTLIIGQIQNLVTEQYEWLSDLEKELLCWLAIEQQPSLVDTLVDNFVQPQPKQQIFQMLQSIYQRSLLIRTETGFGLHEIIQSYLLTQIIAWASEEILLGKIDLLNQFALFKAHAHEYARQAQRKRILEPIIVQIRSRLLTPQQQVAHFVTLLENLRKQNREQDFIMPGYAAGNIFNLARVMGLNIQKLDFSGLAVWQAYMANLSLHKISFKNAHLRFANLTQAFDAVLTLAFSPDGRFLATGTLMGEVSLWQVLQRQQLFLAQGHRDWVIQSLFSRDQKYLYSAGYDGLIHKWDVEHGQPVLTFTSHAGRVVTIAVSPDDKILASGGDDDLIRIWDCATGELIRVLDPELPKPSWVHKLDFHPTEPLLISGDGDNINRLWDLQTGECIKHFHQHTQWVWDARFSPDGSFVGSSGHDGRICLWGIDEDEPLHVWDISPAHARSIAFTHDNQYLIAGLSNGHVLFWATHSGEKVAHLSGHEGLIHSIDVHPTQPLLATGGEDRSLRLWDITTYRPIEMLNGFAKSVRTLAVSPDGTTLASGNADFCIYLWDIQTAKCVGRLDGHTRRIECLTFSPSGETLISGSFDRTVRIWDLKEQRCRLVLSKFERYVSDVAISPDGEMLIAATYGFIPHLWDMRSGVLMETLPQPPLESSYTYGITFSPDGSTIVVVGEDGNILVWDLQGGQAWRVIAGHDGPIWNAEFSSDGQYLATSGKDGTVSIWQVVSWSLSTKLMGHNVSVEGLALSPDNGQVASSDIDGVIHLWDVEKGELVTTLRGHTGVVIEVHYLDQQTLASCSQDGTIRFWQVETGQCQQILMADRIYEGMDITGVNGLTDAQLRSLRELGAVDDAVA